MDVLSTRVCTQVIATVALGGINIAGTLGTPVLHPLLDLIFEDLDQK